MRPRTLAALILVAALTAPARAQCQPRWLPGEGIPGANANDQISYSFYDGYGHEWDEIVGLSRIQPK